MNYAIIALAVLGMAHYDERDPRPWLAAACNLLTALKSCSSITHITIDRSSVPLDTDFRFLEDTVLGWHHVVLALKKLVEIKTELHEINTELHSRPADGFTDGLMVILKTAQPSMEAINKEAVERTRRHTLLGLHPRVGACCMLQLLPTQVLRQILDAAAPPGGCKIKIN